MFPDCPNADPVLAEMNTETGRIYTLREDIYTLRQEVGDDPLQERTQLMDLTMDERDFLTDRAAGANIVPVSAQVAQVVKLGQREQQRRKKRRKAQGASRKRNR